ncbi:ABC transporter substrate-binding protein [Roseomonas elaeocarpi]|uniref:Thiamine pyrimidine synthase n=1 Tax=Roseomonas elaeocarpi TaxID=907779 RepID=A0ABV6JPD1_9PROT
MIKNRAWSRRGLMVLGALAAPAVVRAQTPTRLRLVLNFAVDGSTAPYYFALDRGYFRDAGLNVQIDPSNGSGDAISRVASGTYDVGVGDLSTLLEFTVRQPEAAPKAVFILQNRSPQAVISLRSAGIKTPADLSGKTIGNGASDAPSRMFPAFLKINGVDPAQVKPQQLTPQLRDQMLLTRQVQAVTGFDYTTWFNIKANGTKLEDVSFLYYADYGLNCYGNALLAGKAILRDNPEAVRAFVRAAVRGWREAIADPAAACRVLRTYNNLADIPLETERLQWVGQHQLLSPATRARGLGDVEPARLVETIRAVSDGFALARVPAAEELYDGRFLPPQAERMPLT